MQMAGLAGVHAKRIRQPDNHTIKALDQADSISFRLIRRERWQHPSWRLPVRS